ncbi:MAG: MBL fold metallo-hydrolase [Bacteroidales bacterium]|nr:MBL fold metallo-hydrolase [Bacteroidales bacterium]
MKAILLSAMMLFPLGASAQSDTLYTKSDKPVVITPIKHGTLQIEYNGKNIHVDPVTQLPPVTDYSKFAKADYIFVTHEHFDHLDVKAIEQLTKEGTVIVANPNSAQQLTEAISMKNGEEKEFKDMKVEAVPAYNNSADKQQFHSKGRDNGYVLTIDGLRIYIAGDTEDIPELADLKDIDVAFLPCNLPYTMTPEQLAKAAKTIQPKVLYPYHYSETKIEKVVELLKDSGIEVRIRNFQ